jgi:hypothetical protein
LVVFLRTTCEYCLYSVPFYRELSDQRRLAGHEFQLILAGYEAQDALASFAARNGIAADRVVSVPVEQLRVEATPTLVLTNSSGVVESVWIGEIPQAQHQMIVQQLGS